MLGKKSKGKTIDILLAIFIIFLVFNLGAALIEECTSSMEISDSSYEKVSQWRGTSPELDREIDAALEDKRIEYGEFRKIKALYMAGEKKPATQPVGG